MVQVCAKSPPCPRAATRLKARDLWSRRRTKFAARSDVPQGLRPARATTESPAHEESRSNRPEDPAGTAERGTSHEPDAGRARRAVAECMPGAHPAAGGG